MSPALTIDWFNTAKFEPEYACVDRDFDDAPPPIVRNGVVEMHPDTWGAHDNDEKLWHYRMGGRKSSPIPESWSSPSAAGWQKLWPELIPEPGAAVRRHHGGHTFYYLRADDKQILTPKQLSTLRELARVGGVVCFESLI